MVEYPCVLQSMELQRVRHDSVTEQQRQIYIDNLQGCFSYLDIP